MVQEFWSGLRARRAVAHEAVPVALVSLVRRNRRRYGGYLVHLGVMVLFVGVAASSSFQNIHDARLSPGQSTRVGSYTFTYVKPTSQLHAASNGRLERISFGAVLRVKRDGEPRAADHHHQGLLPVAGSRRSVRCRASSRARRRARSA